MDRIPLEADRMARPETTDEAQSGFAWEAAMIAEADVAPGRLGDEAEMDGWLDSISTDHELPSPRSGR